MVVNIKHINWVITSIRVDEDVLIDSQKIANQITQYYEIFLTSNYAIMRTTIFLNKLSHI